MSLVHIYALANVLRRPIVLLGGTTYDSHLFLPDRHEPADCLMPNGEQPSPLIIGWQVCAACCDPGWPPFACPHPSLTLADLGPRALRGRCFVGGYGVDGGHH